MKVEFIITIEIYNEIKLLNMRFCIFRRDMSLGSYLLYIIEYFNLSLLNLSSFHSFIKLYQIIHNISILIFPFHFNLQSYFRIDIIIANSSRFSNFISMFITCVVLSSYHSFSSVAGAANRIMTKLKNCNIGKYNLIHHLYLSAVRIFYHFYIIIFIKVSIIIDKITKKSDKIKLKII